MTGPAVLADCPYCGHARREVDLLREGDRLGIEHWPPWRARECPGPSISAIGVADAERPAPTDYAVGLAEGWRQAVEVVARAMAAVRAEPRIEGVPSDRRGRVVALGALLDEMIKVAPR